MLQSIGSQRVILLGELITTTIKHSNIYIIGVSDGKEKDRYNI